MTDSIIAVRSGWDGPDIWLGILQQLQCSDNSAGDADAEPIDKLRSMVQGQPLPTIEQTAAFADHVAFNHSWYKHLPMLPPGALFAFVINPNAGRGILWSGDRATFHDIENGDYFAHHSRLSTDEYRQRFGVWDYFWIDNPRGMEPFADSSSANALAAFGKERPVAGMLEVCWGRFTAFLRPHSFHVAMAHNALPRDLARYRRYTVHFPSDPEVVRAARLADLIEECLASTENIWWQCASFADAEVRQQKVRIFEVLFRAREAWGRILGAAGTAGDLPKGVPAGKA